MVFLVSSSYNRINFSTFIDNQLDCVLNFQKLLAIQSRALSITQGRAVGVAHYLLGGIATTWALFEARIISVG